MTRPIKNHVGTIFIPVSDIEKAKDWYCDFLGLPANGEILFDHLYVLPMEGTGIVLDSKIYAEGNIINTPLFHFNTEDIKVAYAYSEKKQIELVTTIQHEHYFTFKDPDGNHLMVCKC